MISVGFGVEVSATCRDCGAVVPNPLDLRGRTKTDTADSCAQGVVFVDAPGACKACGGGRVAVKTSFSVA